MYALTIGALSGALLGLRFKVFVLVPAIFIAIIATCVGWMLGSDGLASALWELASTSIGLQLGYVAGVGARVAASNLGKIQDSVRPKEG
jgi:hypothetical protein